MAGTPLKNLRIFQKLCGKEALRHIIFTTTMWDDVQDDEGERREKELRTKYWKTMIDQGSMVARFFSTLESAWNVVEPLLLEANDRCAVQIQEEMVDLKKQLPETKAGKELYNTLDKLVQMQRDTLKRIREETGRSGDDRILAQLKIEYDELRKNLETTITDMQKLKLPLRTRLVRMLLLPLGLSAKVHRQPRPH